jgi:CheY-like chemotaxis protein
MLNLFQCSKKFHKLAKSFDERLMMEDKYTWNNKNILIVEDDDSSSFLLGEILRKTGASLSYAFSGNEAVTYIKEHPATDLVLMDVQLPDKDGLTATKEIKEINKKIVVITQSAYLNLVRSREESDNHSDDFLSKPINPRLLLTKMKTFLG